MLINKGKEVKKMARGKTYKKRAKEIWQEAEEEKALEVDISYRGGGVGIRRSWLIWRIGSYVNEDYNPYDLNYLEAYLPRYFGAGCNYLGGGIRGTISPSGFNNKVWELYPKVARLLDEIQNLAVEKYKEYEEELNLQEWDKWGYEATEQARRQGIVSAY